MIKIGGWVITEQAGDNWMRSHPECYFNLDKIPENYHFASLTYSYLLDFVPIRLGKHGKGRIILTEWPKVRSRISVFMGLVAP